MRIGIRVPHRTSGGGAVFHDQLVSALHEQGADVRRFVMGPHGASAPSLRTGDAPVGVSARASVRRLRGGSALARAVDRAPVDVMLSPGTEVHRVEGVPGIMWPLTVAPLEVAALRQLGSSARQRARWRLLAHSLRSAVRQADAFVFSSHYARSLYQQEMPEVRARPSCVIAPASSIPPTGGPHPGADTVRRPYLLFVSHLYPYKMVVELIQGWALARGAGADFDLVIAGAANDPAYSARVDAAVASSGWSDRVHLLGNVPSAQLPGLYAGASAFVFPSLSENAGSYALIDAFAMGVPVLASSTSSTPEACQDAARYFDPRDPGHLAQEIVRFSEDPDLGAELGARSRRRGAEYRGWDEVASRLTAFAQEIGPPGGVT